MVYRYANKTEKYRNQTVFSGEKQETVWYSRGELQTGLQINGADESVFYSVILYFLCYKRKAG